MANESYDKEKEEKFLFDVEFNNTWTLKVKRYERNVKISPQIASVEQDQEGFQVQYKWRDGDERIFEEARLKVEALEQKQVLSIA